MTPRISSLEAIIWLGISILTFLFGVCYALFINSSRLKLSMRSFEKRVAVFSGALLVSTWCMRFMVGYSGLIELGDKVVLLSRPLEFFNSLVHAFQSFSMDEDYTEYLAAGRKLMALLFPGRFSMVRLYSVHVSVLHVICPIVGGAILLAILTSFFPRIELMIKKAFYWGPVCYFSELNDESLALAESIRSRDTFPQRALIIFSDVYTDKDDEEKSERIRKAKYLGAVCLREDISDLSISSRKGKMFFLMDRNEIGNLQALAAFRSDKAYERLDHSDKIYVFGNDDSSQMVVDSVDGFLKKQLGEEKSPFVMRVSGMRNLVYNLLAEKPLFSAKNQKEKVEEEPLRIAIFGSGRIGTEMFLAAYWCGQMLDYKLCITVVSVEEEAQFKARIDHINPELFKTSQQEPEPALLRIYADQDSPLSPPYFSFEYVEADVRQADLYAKLLENGDNGRIVDADYFMVALGSDEDNLETADKLGRYVSRSKLGASGGRVPIAYVVFNDALNEQLKLNRDGEYPFVDLYPFGSLSETYSFNKITFEGRKDAEKTNGDIYQVTISQMITSDKSLEDYYRDSYSYWANVARSIHIQYKAFCAGITTKQYITDAKNEDSPINQDQDLAWLEHRRWNAFMRVSGFTAPSLKEEENYIGLLPDIRDPDDKTNKGKHKNLALKLHPGIVECVRLKKIAEPGLKDKADLLDDAQTRLKNDYPNKNLKVGTFKKFDYPLHDYHH